MQEIPRVNVGSFYHLRPCPILKMSLPKKFRTTIGPRHPLHLGGMLYEFAGPSPRTYLRLLTGKTKKKNIFRMYL